MKKLASIVLILSLAFTLAACGSSDKPAASVKLIDVFGKFSVGEEMMALTQNDLLDLYGIAAADVKQFAGAVNTTGIKCDEIVLVEAVSSEAAGRVKTALDNRYQAKLNEMDGYLPDEYAIVKECSVTQNGNFVAMIVSPNAQALTGIYNEAFK